jgi:hypothetical protein
MLIEAEISSMELIRQLLSNHSPEYLFNRIATECRHINPEEFTRKVTKLLEDGIE